MRPFYASISPFKLFWAKKAKIEPFWLFFGFLPVFRTLWVTRHFRNPKDLVVQLFSYTLRENFFRLFVHKSRHALKTRQDNLEIYRTIFWHWLLIDIGANPLWSAKKNYYFYKKSLFLSRITASRTIFFVAITSSRTIFSPRLRSVGQFFKIVLLDINECNSFSLS